MMIFPFSSDLIGYLAAFLTTTAFVPQAWMTWRRKRAEGVSLGMYIILVTGIMLWLIYGLMLHALPVIIANMITLVLASFILVMKLVYK
ncbi:SemiSWEET transporter [Undibacterium sp. Ji50W]|uniref:SemiSWEET transporter n=1 Tax=Undibacterium TaxID=401469 RepID=UPI003BF1B02D